MTEPTKTSRRADVLMYGTVLVLALVGAIIAVSNAYETEQRDPLPVAPVAPMAASESEPPPPEAQGPVPELPAVPDLRTQPPPPRPTDIPEDPRFAELAGEMRYLSRARELLAEHPADALSILEQHRRAHPRGALREEREAFAIEALVAMDERAAAERRYYDFQRAFPGSDFTSRLETLMRMR